MFQNDEDSKLNFINGFFARTWISLHSSVNDRALFWKSLMRVEKTRAEVLQRKMEVGAFSLSQSQLAGLDHPSLLPTPLRWMATRCDR